MTHDSLTLAADFPATTYEDWLRAVEPVLKGAPFDKKLLTRTAEGLTIKPIYIRQDWPAAGDPSGFPGFTPFTRGAAAAGRVDGWDIRQEHAHPDPAVANQEILTDLKRGAGSLLIRFDDAARRGFDPVRAPDGAAGRGGVMVYSVEDLDRLLDSVILPLVPIALDAGPQFMAAAGLLAALWQRRGVAPAEARGAFNADPLGAWAAEGSLPETAETALADMADLAVLTARTYPQVTAVQVSTAPYHGAGADEAFDLGCALSTGVAYLRALTGAGMTIEAALGQMVFALPVGCDLFLGIAKLRAARKLWARITEACGAPEPARALRITARSADFMMTRYDPWVNMLRTTVAGFAAAAGGAETIILHPYGAALGPADALGRRVARNTQIVLDEESALNRVIDPAGGSWYIESLTDELARAAWARFQELEAAGGMIRALESGLIHTRIDDTHAARLKNLATRRQPITGVSEFPNVTETLPQPEPPDLPSLRAAAAARLAELRTREAPEAQLDDLADAGTDWPPGSIAARVIAAANAGATIGSIAAAFEQGPPPITPLPQRRLAEPFEELRDAGVAFAAATGQPPRIFLANLGPVAQHTARATFAKNFFEAGGVHAVGREGFTNPDALVAAYHESGAATAILCSSDALYEQMAVPMAEALKKAGCTHLFLAGNPGDKKQTYLAAGVDEFIFVGCNLLDVLRATLVRLGAIAS